MIYEIVETILNSFSVSFSDLVVGIVKPMVISDVNGQQKRFPVIHNTDEDACIMGDYIDLLPNSERKSVIYFEDFGTEFIEQRGDDMYFQSTIRLVCWFNYKKINVSLTTDSLIMANVMKAMPTRVLHAYIGRINIQVLRHLPKDPEQIFGKYTYNEAEVQYVTYPYDCFAIDYIVDYSINMDCINPVTDNPEEC